MDKCRALTTRARHIRCRPCRAPKQNARKPSPRQIWRRARPSVCAVLGRLSRGHFAIWRQRPACRCGRFTRSRRAPARARQAASRWRGSRTRCMCRGDGWRLVGRRHAYHRAVVGLRPRQAYPQRLSLGLACARSTELLFVGRDAGRVRVSCILSKSSVLWHAHGR